MKKEPKAEVFEEQWAQGPDGGTFFRWRIKAANGRIIADSGEGYATRAKAHEALWRVIYACAYIGPRDHRVVDV